ncbi:hypothetical protein M569_11549 [Genlisea aurea]|uniref:BRCT domain-containing protein n=1 Tax=Genlisea aurea TaxID=192259 RepID=S8C8T1_9LAMI|nr:hypothetical protein M569_11549 [Genlisea aurea]
MSEDREIFMHDRFSRTFRGVRFVLFGFDSAKGDEVRMKLLQGGGVDSKTYGPDCTHVIVDRVVCDDPLCIAARKDGKVLVTGLWVDHSSDAELPMDPSSASPLFLLNDIMYRPVRDLSGIPGARSLVICLTGYLRADRDDIMTMVSIMGATFSKPLVANKVTHLICYKFEGEKYELAKKLKKIKLVNHLWLEDCLKAWKLLPEVDYNKSGFELECELEAKDSEDEAEEMQAVTDLGRKIVLSPKNIGNGNARFYQLPAKHEISGSPSLSASKALSYSGGSLATRLSPRKEISVRNYPEIPSFPNAGISGKLSPEVPSQNKDPMIIPDVAEASLQLPPQSARKYLSVDVPGTSCNYFVTKNSESLEGNSGNLLLDKLGDVPFEGKSDGTDSDILTRSAQKSSNGDAPKSGSSSFVPLPEFPMEEAEDGTSSGTHETSLKGTSLSNKRKGNVSGLCFGSSTSKRKILESFAPPRSAYDGNTSPVGCNSGEGIHLLFEASKVSNASVDDRENNDETIQHPPDETSSKNSIMKSSSGKTNGALWGIEVQQDELQSDSVSKQSRTQTVTTPETSANLLKPDCAKMSVKESLGSKPSYYKRRATKNRGHILLKKGVLPLESTSLFVEEETKKDSDSTKISENVAMASTDPNDEESSLSGVMSKSLGNDKSNESEKPCVMKRKGKKQQPLAKSETSAIVNEETQVLDIPAKGSSRRTRKSTAKVDTEKENKPTVFSSTSEKSQMRKSSKSDTVPEQKDEPRYFIFSGSRIQRKEFQSAVKKLKGRICRGSSHQWSYQATHFVVPEPVRRTEKFFATAASGRWILKPDYLTASVEAGRFVEEEPFEWHAEGSTEDGAIDLEAPRKWRLLRERTGHGAFHGMKIVIYGECTAPPLDTLKRAVKSGGGTVLATSPPYTRFLRSGDVDFAVVGPGTADAWIEAFVGREVPCVAADYLVDLVCRPGGCCLAKHVRHSTHEWAERALRDHMKRVEEVEGEGEEGFDDEDLECEGCGRVDGEEEMLICGGSSDEKGVGCGVGWHIFCLDPPLQNVPTDDWFCPSCRNPL